MKGLGTDELVVALGFEFEVDGVLSIGVTMMTADRVSTDLLFSRNDAFMES